MINFDVKRYNNNKRPQVIVNERAFTDMTLGHKLEQYV
jgi:hypothetical protein